jgi:hypothetical protein
VAALVDAAALPPGTSPLKKLGLLSERQIATMRKYWPPRAGHSRDVEVEAGQPVVFVCHRIERPAL